MKLKVLGMCAIASLLYGENVCAGKVQSNGNNTKATQGENSGVSKDINHNINRTNGPSAMNRKNHQRNKKKKANSQSASETLSVGQNLGNGTAEDKELTDQNLGNGTVEDKSLIYKEIVNNVNQTFSEFENDFEDFKLTANSFLNNTLDNPTLSVEERKHSANFFNQAKENIITKVNELNLVLYQASEILKIFENLKIDGKIQEVKAYETEIEKLINDINEKRKSQKRQKKQDKQASKQVIGEIDWAEIDKYYTENLSKFALKARDFKFKFGDIMYYGGKCFENQDGSMFNPQQEMDSSLRSLCTQIFKVHFPAARNAYLEIKKMTKEAQTKEVLEDFRSKILALYGSVESLLKQQSNIDEKKKKDEENKKKMEEAIKREGNGYEE